MNYKILRVEFINGTNEYNIPIGWAINQVIFATDTHAVFVLHEVEQQRINDYGRNPTGYVGYAPTEAPTALRGR